MSYFLFICPLLVIYIFARGVWPAFSGWKRWAAGTVLLPGMAYPLVLRFYGTLLPPWAVIAGSTFLSIIWCALVLFAARDVVTIAARAFGVPFSKIGMSRRLSLVLCIVSVAAAVWGIWEGTRIPRVHEFTVEVPGLPEGLDGMKIAQLSDLHASAVLDAERQREIVERLMSRRPDLIAVTGDNVDGTVETRGPDLLPLEGLSAPLGVWGCEGNHEHYQDYEGWMKFLPALGIRMLANSHAVLERNGTPFVIAGLTDQTAERFGRELPDAEKALAGAPEGVFTIMLSHRPAQVKLLPPGRVGLQLSGHTHGGQTPFAAAATFSANDRLLRGLYDRSPQASVLYVHPGSGEWVGFLLRIFDPAEIAVMTLRKGRQ